MGTGGGVGLGELITADVVGHLLGNLLGALFRGGRGQW